MDEGDDRRETDAAPKEEDRREDVAPVDQSDDEEGESSGAGVSTTTTTTPAPVHADLIDDDEERDFSVEDNRLPEAVAAAGVPETPPATDDDPHDLDDADPDDNQLSSLPAAATTAHRPRNIPPEVTTLHCLYVSCL